MRPFLTEGRHPPGDEPGGRVGVGTRFPRYGPADGREKVEPMSGPGDPPPLPPGYPPPWGGPPAGAGQPYPPTYPYAPSPGSPWVPPAQRRRSRWLTIALPLGVLLVLGGCGTAFVLAFTAFTGTVGPATDAGKAYASALVEQRWDDAHAMLCDGARDGITAEQLATRYGRPRLTGYSIAGVHVQSSGGQSSGEVTVRFVTEDGFEELTVVPMVRDGADWRPCP